MGAAGAGAVGGIAGSGGCPATFFCLAATPMTCEEGEPIAQEGGGDCNYGCDSGVCLCPDSERFVVTNSDEDRHVTPWVDRPMEVLDTETGLSWFWPHPSATHVSQFGMFREWGDATALCEDLDNVPGYEDARLPTQQEWYDLMFRAGGYAPHCNPGSPFPEAIEAMVGNHIRLWTSTEVSELEVYTIYASHPTQMLWVEGKAGVERSTVCVRVVQ